MPLAEAVLRFLTATAAARGCLLILEDLHWADPETLVILEYLADNVAGEGVLCVATWRTDDRAGGLDVLRSLDARRASRTVTLGRLDADEVADMVSSCLGTEAVPQPVQALAARAEGVPFLVEELLAAALASGLLLPDGDQWMLGAEPGPAAVVPLTFLDTVQRRLTAIGPAARSVLVAAALLGRRFEWRLLPGVTGLDEEATLAGLRQAVGQGLVEADPDPALFRFRHALTRDAVLSDALPPERASVAARACAAIEAASPQLDGDWCQRAAELAIEGGRPRRAVELLHEVGRRAIGVGALATAETALERARELALQLAPDGEPAAADVEEDLVEVLASVGKVDRAEAVGRSVLARLGTDETGAGRRAAVELRLARAAAVATRWEDAAGHLTAARGHGAMVLDESLVARADALDALIALGLDQPDRAATLARAAHAAADRLGLPEVACEALEVIGRCARLTDLAAAEAAFEEARTIAERHRLPLWRLRALHELGTIDMLRSGAIGRLEEARELASSLGALATGAVLDIQLCGTLVARDDPEPAVTVARRAAAVARRLGLGGTLGVALGFEANAHARAGRRADMEQCIAEAYVHAGGDPSIDVFAACARTALALRDDDRAAALEHAEEVAGDARFFSPLVGWWVLLKALDPERGDAAVESVRAAGEPAHYLARPYFFYAEAVVLGRHGRGEEAMAKVARGDELLEGFEGHRQIGRRWVAEAALVDGWGEPATWAREALARFEAWGQPRPAVACRSLLRRAGAPVPRRGRGHSPVPPELAALGVTSREIDVLALVAAGLSNREVAAHLVLSVRTVENHVEKLLAKTGAQRRSGLGDVAARAGVDRPVI